MGDIGRWNQRMIVANIGERQMPRNVTKSGKQDRPKTAIKGKRYLCAGCRKRSPKPIKAPAPWYCPKCLARREQDRAQ